MKSKNEEGFNTSSKKKTKEEVRPPLNRAGDLVIKEMEKSEVLNASGFIGKVFFLGVPAPSS